MEKLDPSKSLAEQTELVRASLVKVGDAITRWDGTGHVVVHVTKSRFTGSGHLALDTTGGTSLFGAGGHVRRLVKS